MKAALDTDVCVCRLDVRQQIWRCPHFRYWKVQRRFTSVSNIIHTVLPTDYSAVDAAVLENARVRGQFIDIYFSEWLTSPDVMLSPLEFRELITPDFTRDTYKNAVEHAEDTRVRLERLLAWWGSSQLKATHVQHIVHSDADGVAGTFDFGTEEKIIDLKCVSQLQPSYALQLGAYLAMDEQKFPLRDPAVLHVTKDKIKLIPYDGKKCKRQWQSAAAWYFTLQELA